MATSSNVFIVFVVFAVAMLIAVFAWVAGNKRSQKPTSVRPQPGVCRSRATSTATRRRPPLSSSTTQWDHADTMDTDPQPPQTCTSPDGKDRQNN
jgi:hypothetical protein